MASWTPAAADGETREAGPATTPLIRAFLAAGLLAGASLGYFLVSRQSNDASHDNPLVVALLLVGNLITSSVVLVLIGRSIARRRAARSESGGNGQLHIRLVALFSTAAAVPMILVTVAALLISQSGADFWGSNRARSAFEHTINLVRESRNQIIGRWVVEAQNTAFDLSRDQAVTPLGSKSLNDVLAGQAFYRSLRQVTLFRQEGSKIVVINNASETSIPPLQTEITSEVFSALRSGQPFVGLSADSVWVVVNVPNSGSTYLYVATVLNASFLNQQLDESRLVVADYDRLQRRSGFLKLLFNGSLFLITLLIVGIAVWIALRIADRLVRPVGEMVGATRRVAGGDLTARVPDPRTNDEIGALADAFNTMTARLEQQTGALESRRALIETVMSGVSAGVVSVGGDGAIRLINASAARLLRIEADAAVGARLVDVAPDLADMLHGDQREAIVELGSGGEARTLAVRAAAGQDGRVLTFDDITQQLLDQRRAAWSDVARRIAHEIKNPLTPIQLAAERLQRRYGKTIDPADGVFGQLTETIVRQVGDLRQIVDEFSSFARMPKPMFHEESLIDLTRQALFLHEVAHPAIRFTLDAPDAALLVCDRRQIGQALTNIVKNAVEAIAARGDDKAGEISVALRPDSPDVNRLTVEIADDGIGLPVERDRIVEPYMTTRARGTGLGLAIVKKIVEEHCGTIAFADRPDGGTIVTIIFDTAALDALLGAHSDPIAGSGDGALTMLTRNRS